MLLVTANAQGELTPIERGRHALGSDMDVKAYADSVGRAKEYRTVVNETYAAKVANAVADVCNDKFYQLVEIHAAPEWLWSALVAAMVEGKWTVELTRKQVARFKGAPEPPDMLDGSGLVVNGRSRSTAAWCPERSGNRPQDLERAPLRPMVGNWGRFCLPVWRDDFPRPEDETCRHCH
jgi:hypothetical protein